MYKVSNNISFRLNEDQRNQLNALAEELQTIENTTFSNARELVFSLLNQYTQLKNNCLQPEYNPNTEANTSIQDVNTEANTSIQEPNTDIQEVNTENRKKLIDAIGYESDPTDENLFSDLLSIITTPAEQEKTEIEVIKEVVKPLEKGEVLVKITEREYDLLDKISRYRVQKKIDPARKTISNVIYSMVFNVGNLTNDHGEFETGLNRRRLKK